MSPTIKVQSTLVFKAFSLALLYCDLRNIHPYSMEIFLGKPYGVVPGAAADIQCLTRGYERRCDSLNKGEIRFADILGSIACLISFLETFTCRFCFPAGGTSRLETPDSRVWDVRYQADSRIGFPEEVQNAGIQNVSCITPRPRSKCSNLTVIKSRLGRRGPTRCDVSPNATLPPPPWGFATAPFR